VLIKNHFTYSQTQNTHKLKYELVAKTCCSYSCGCCCQILGYAEAICKAQPDARIVVTASFLEIHNEELRDLLAVPGVPQKVLLLCFVSAFYVV
jgi:hypothetical protein